MSYQPIESQLKCDWLTCYAGLGLAGSGFCFADGTWWKKCCPEFKDEDKWLEEEEERYEIRVTKKRMGF